MAGFLLLSVVAFLAAAVLCCLPRYREYAQAASYLGVAFLIAGIFATGPEVYSWRR